jgi:hypothetical protein
MSNQSTPKKRTFEDLSEIEPSSTATIHCSIEAVSPLKKGKSGIDYFDGLVTDGSKKVRIYGFDGRKQDELSLLQMKNEAVKLENCYIKPTQSENLEMLIIQ